MKKSNWLFILIFTFSFTIQGCSCKNEEIIKKNEAINILKESLVTENVEITTTTETCINGIKTISLKKDIYYEEKYYHLSENNNISTKTWYGKINNTLYAFYYKKNSNNEETKTSSRIENKLLESTKKQPNSIINSLINNNGNLLDNNKINATKKGNTYSIEINSTLESEIINYKIIIDDFKINKIVKTSTLDNDYITTIYEYNYNVTDIELPSLTEYPLRVNG